MPNHWYTYMFEVGGRVAGNTTSGKLYPGTNNIFGKCTSPTTCKTGVTPMGKMTTLAACQAAVTSSAMHHFRSYTWHHLDFSGAAWAGHCYGISSNDLVLRPQAKVDSGTLPYTNSHLEFSTGGFQGGEGVHPDGLNLNRSRWYIENVIEEIDSPREWFFNETTRVLYYMPNATANGTLDKQGMPTGEFKATGLKVLINMTGTMRQPVVNVTVAGLTLRDASYTVSGRAECWGWG
jgi:hypothetical protein